MWPIIAAIAQGIGGAVKNSADKKREASDRQLAADTQRYSWITGNQAGPIKQAGSLFGDVAQGAVSGAMFGQGLEQLPSPSGPGATGVATLYGGGSNVGLGNKIMSGLSLDNQDVGRMDTSYGGIGNQPGWQDMLKKMRG